MVTTLDTDELDERGFNAALAAFERRYGGCFDEIDEPAMRLALILAIRVYLNESEDMAPDGVFP